MGDLSKVDTFSLAVLLINLLTGKYAFNHWTDASYKKLIESPGDIVAQMADLTTMDQSELSALEDLLKGMLHPQIDKRLTMEEVLAHEWA